jgi:hypothetical protein
MSTCGGLLRSAHGPPNEPFSLQIHRCDPFQQPCMNSRICRCCGEPMPEHGNPRSRNPNICASCSSMADGMEESSLPESTGVVRDTTEAVAEDQLREHAAEPAVHRIPM